MCGISGFNWPDKQLIKRMNQVQRDRGPDSGSFFVDSSISLGHRRLSIMDPSKKGSQPMLYRGLVITFNGEIYNFKEIRSKLVQKGHKFKTQTDTEVILHSYAEWGAECVTNFNGMWALAIYDTNRKELFLSRDRFGIKPLYYYLDSHRFIFASKVTAIRQHPVSLSLNQTALHRYFFQKYIGGEYSLFTEIASLLPGHNALVTLTPQPKVSIQKYFDLHQEINHNTSKPLTERLESIPDLLKSAVKLRLIADVSVGSFLSGGLDSSLLTAIAAHIQGDFSTFSIGFPQKSFDERTYAKQVADSIGTTHTSQELVIDDEVIETVLNSCDEPLADPSLIPTYSVSMLAKPNVSVALSGDGADEVFGGYDTYRANQLAKYFSPPLIKLLRPITKSFPPSEKKVSRLFMIQRFFERFNDNQQLRHLYWMATVLNRDALVTTPLHSSIEETYRFNQFSSVTGVQVLDMDNFLPGNMLKKIDMASMAHGLEVRVPFLDYRLVPIVLSLPDRYKVSHFKQKILLKQLAVSYLPNKIIHRRKRGFSVPINQVIKQSQLLKHFLLSSESFNHSLIDQQYTHQLYTQHLNNQKDTARELWSVFVFNYWWSKFGI